MGSEDVRRTAVRVQLLADEVRRLADRMLSAATVQWRSAAAAEFRERLHDEAAGVRSAGSHLDDAAEALRHHAVAIDTLDHWFGGER